MTLSHCAMPGAVDTHDVHTTWLSPTRLAPLKTSIVMICWSPTLGPGVPRSICVGGRDRLAGELEALAVVMRGGAGGGEGEGDDRDREESGDLHGPQAPGLGVAGVGGAPETFPLRAPAAAASAS